MEHTEWEVQDLGSQLSSVRVVNAVSESLPGNGATRKSLAYWNWKHVENPFGQTTGSVGICVTSGDVVGVRSFMRWTMIDPRSPQQVLHVARAVDTVTAKAWRGKGVFRRLTLAALSDLERDGFILVFNTPNQNSAPGYLKMGWRSAGHVPLFIRPLRPLSLSVHVLQAALGLSDRKEPAISSLERWGQSSGISEVVVSHERARASKGLRTVRDLNYLDWRYGAHPQADYRVIIDGPRDSPTGVAVVRSNRRHGADELVLLEMWAIGARLDYLSSLVARVIRLKGFDYVIGHFAAGSVEYKVLRRSMFMQVPQDRLRLFVRPLISSAETGLADMRRWDLSLGDLELF